MHPRRFVVRWAGALVALIVALSPLHAWAAAELDGASMGWPYALPFAGLLLSIALGPLSFHKFWHHHYGKIAAAWALLALGALVWRAGGMAALAALVHAMLAEYLGFIVLLFSLYVVAGGILISGDIKGTPAANTGILALGTLMASLVGTTGAAMILIRPLIRANRPRRHNVHVVIFFIILVANVGGALSPLGDPPLFVGFLHGVDFFWTTRNLWLQTAIVAGVLLVIFAAVDVWRFRSEPSFSDAGSAKPVRIRGLINLLLIAAIVASLLVSAMWKPGIAFGILGTKLELEDVVRNIVLLAIAALSVWLTPDEHRQANGFTWEPIREVAKLFAAIFVAIIPVIAMLDAGHHGAFAWLLSAVTAPDGTPREVAYFWFTGLMSAFLDNAPTYLLFFELAGGDPLVLMNELSGTLASISMGAVYMGALTYIGNAPNFMVSSIAKESGIEMPSFFGYLLRAGAVLMPLFLLLTILPIAPILHWH
ncbi:sodium:proton antiporter [Bradyrhizobium centrolobii]|uniref:Sodium:proton antiporter n=1 Tax=Bradyrhizobium centrolobii TaxID=1505087 RepID=A0A176YMQ5_9BRAD|nr:sodium:proton antiporter [Bradyrhizobium centrolobii]OAF08415.1 sodium:proton antiporter [Bradyrhizobium centrolobii]